MRYFQRDAKSMVDFPPKESSDGIVAVFHYKNGAITTKPDIPIEDIQENPEMFIEKGCLDICKCLWKLNIPTRESEAHDNHSFVVLGQLSEQNKTLFSELAKSKPNNYLITEFEFAKKGYYGKLPFPPNMKYACFKFRENTYIIYDTKSSVLDTSLINGFYSQSTKKLGQLKNKTTNIIKE